MARMILHLDLDAFFCSVEELKDPSLRGKPFAVGGRPDQRGVVASCSYAARQLGIRSAMPMARAMRLCPKLILVRGQYKDYREASDKVMDIMRQISPSFEQISIDEAFIDISLVDEAGEILAERLQKEINETVGLPCSIGVASNKLVAKIATDAGKAAALKRGGPPNPPNAITIVPPGEEAAFLAPLPAQALWGVGPRTAERLAEIGIHTIGELADWPEQDLVERFGSHASGLIRHARGISSSPITTKHVAKSHSQETTFAKDIRDPEKLKETLRNLSEQIGKYLVKRQRTGRTVRLKLRWSDFTTLSRQVTLARPTDQSEDIYQAVLAMFESLWQKPRPVRLLGVGIRLLPKVEQENVGEVAQDKVAIPSASPDKSHQPIQQLSLWDVEPAERQRLREVLKELQERYGEQTIHRGSVKKDPKKD